MLYVLSPISSGHKNNDDYMYEKAATHTLHTASTLLKKGSTVATIHFEEIPKSSIARFAAAPETTGLSKYDHAVLFSGPPCCSIGLVCFK